VRRPHLLVLAAAGLVFCLSPGAASAGKPGVPRWPVWLCFPGEAHDYCNARLTTTAIDAKGKETTTTPVVPASRPIDCFYVYPSVSLQSRGNSNLHVDEVEQEVAVDEASPFEQVCRVFAPMYHQVTGYAQQDHYKYSYELEYTDVRAAWHDYLAHDNDGRGVVLIGHSEGSFILKRLIREEISKTPSERKLLVSALLSGGNVVVANPGSSGTDMPHTPLCTSRTQTGCVVAWSTFDRTPPKVADFESVGNAKTQHVVCVNPADPGSTAPQPVTPWFPPFDSGGIAPLNYGYKFFWISFPGLYTAQCVRQGSRSWLLVARVRHPGDERPAVREVDGAPHGLHEADMTVVLPQLVALVRSESAAYRHR
jgi:hypothetical protein